MADNSIFLIDIDKVLREKAGKKAKRIPRFVVSYLKRIVHQDEINSFLKGVSDKTGVDFLKACMDYLDVKLEVNGLENLPQEGLCTFVSNHPLGGQDGIALGYVLGTHYNGRIKYLVNDLLMNLHGLAPLSSCSPPVSVHADNRGLSKICRGKKLSLPKVLRHSGWWFLSILRVGTQISSTIWLTFVSSWVSNSTLRCFIWRMRCIRIVTRPSR